MGRTDLQEVTPKQTTAASDSETTLPGYDLITSDIGRAIISALIRAFKQDVSMQTTSKKLCLSDIGWRNKYNIHLLSGVSQKVIYKDWGIIEKLSANEAIEKRRSPSNWGQQKHQYRINLETHSYLLFYGFPANSRSRALNSNLTKG